MNKLEYMLLKEETPDSCVKNDKLSLDWAPPDRWDNKEYNYLRYTLTADGNVCVRLLSDGTHTHGGSGIPDWPKSIVLFDFECIS